MGLTLRQNFSWTLAGNVVYAGCQWGMLVVLAKLGNPVMVGQFALGLAVTAPVIMFASLQLRPVQATDARREYEFGHYLGLRLVTTLLALLVIASISLTAGYRRETAMVVLAVGLAKAFESVSDVFYGLLQQAERMDRIAISMMLKGPLTVTHQEIERFFMTIPESVQLVLQAAYMGQGGDIFVLNMGCSVKIMALAEKLIVLAGKTPGKDIDIILTGLRPGEKLYEELFNNDEEPQPTEHPMISRAIGPPVDKDAWEAHVDDISDLVKNREISGLILKFKNIIPNFTSDFFNVNSK